MKHLLTIVLLIGIMLIPQFVQARTFARWHTSMGSFTAELYEETVPITANNFIDLTNSGFYNDLIFHRVVAGFVIQDGCPYGTGYGGPGYTIPDEFSPLFHHDQAGILAMAHSAAPNSAGSQYYFTLAPAAWLDGNYAIFGKVIEGLDVVLAIGQVPVDANDRPLTPVNIYQVRMLDLQVSNVFPDPAETITANVGDPLMFMIEASTQGAQLSFSWYIDEVLQSGVSDFIFEPVMTTGGTHSIRCNIASSDSIAHNVSWTVQASSGVVENTIPSAILGELQTYPNPFNDLLQIDVTLSKASSVSLEIFNLKGRKVRSLNLGQKSSGNVTTQWDGTDENGEKCPVGIYFLKAVSDGDISIGKAMLLK